MSLVIQNRWTAEFYSCVRVQWLISDLIPKKIRKVRISENFCDHIFQCQKLTQKNEILTFFAYAIFEKVQNYIQNL